MNAKEEILNWEWILMASMKKWIQKASFSADFNASLNRLSLMLGAEEWYYIALTCLGSLTLITVPSFSSDLDNYAII